MTLTVFGAPLSPFVRKVRLCLLEKQVDYELEFVMPFTPPDWYYELNPLGRIPALRDDQVTLADSSVICQYLNERHPNNDLLGSTPAARAQVRWLEKYADYEIAPLATFTVFANRLLKPSMGKPCDEALVHKALDEKLPPHFDYLERQLGEREYFVEDRLSMADIAVACQLINLEHGEETVDASRWPGLAAHLARMKARQSVEQILPSEQRMVEKLRAQAPQAQ